MKAMKSRLSFSVLLMVLLAVLCAALPFGALAENTCGAAGCTWQKFNGLDACVTADGCLHICEANFPSAAFREWLTTENVNEQDSYGGYTSGKITLKQCQEREGIYCSSQQIDSLKGIEFFSGLTRLGCEDNWLTELDVSHNRQLYSLYCSANDLKLLDMSGNLELGELSCNSNQLTSLDVSACVALSELWCNSNLLDELNISQNTQLMQLSCSGNRFFKLEVGQNSALENLSCADNFLVSLDVSHNPKLTSLNCDNNNLTVLDVSHNTELRMLNCERNNLIALDMSHNIALESLYSACNQLATLDVSKNTVLELLGCEINKLTSLDVSHNPALNTLWCNSNLLTELDISANTRLTNLNCEDNQLTSLDVSKHTRLTRLWCGDNQLTSLNVSASARLDELRCSGNQLTSLDLSHNLYLRKGNCYISSQDFIGLAYRKRDGGYLARLTDLPGLTLDMIQGITLDIDCDYTFDKVTGTIFFPQKPECTWITYFYPTGNAAVPTLTVQGPLEYASHFKTLTLPENMEVISDEAFLNCTALEAVIAPAYDLHTIGARAFAGCTNLQELYLSYNILEIAEDAFEGCDKLTIIVPDGSYALNFAKEHGLRYEVE